MQVRVTCGPKEDSILHVPYDQHTQGMINSGLWESVPETPKPVEVKWFLFTEKIGDSHNLNSASLGFKCGACRSTYHFLPDVNLGVAKIIEAARPHCAHRTPCPLEIANAYVVAGGGTPISFAAECAGAGLPAVQPAPQRSDLVLALEGRTL